MLRSQFLTSFLCVPSQVRGRVKEEVIRSLKKEGLRAKIDGEWVGAGAAPAAVERNGAAGHRTKEKEKSRKSIGKRLSIGVKKVLTLGKSGKRKGEKGREATPPPTPPPSLQEREMGRRFSEKGDKSKMPASSKVTVSASSFLFKGAIVALLAILSAALLPLIKLGPRLSMSFWKLVIAELVLVIRGDEEVPPVLEKIVEVLRNSNDEEVPSGS